MHRQGHITKNLFVCFGVTFFMLSFLLSLIESIRRIELPFMAWPKNTLFSVDNCLWIFLFLGFIYFLLKNELIFAFMFSFFVTLCRYESIPCIFILMALYYYFFNESRAFSKKFLKFYGIFIIFFSAYTMLLCLMQKGGNRYLTELIYDKIFIRFDFARRFIHKNFNFVTTEDKIWGYFSWSNTWLFTKTSLLSTYFFIVLFLIPSRDKIMRLISVFGIIFFISIASQSFKLITYVLLLIPLSAINIRRFIYPSVNVKLFITLSYMVIWYICKYLTLYY